MYVNLLTQLTIKKDILYIKLRDGPLPNRRHNKKSVYNGHMSNQSKCLIIIMTMFLLNVTGNKMSLIALKRTIRADLNLMYPLTSDRTNISGTRHKISRVSPLKSTNLLTLRMLLFRMKNSWRRENNCCERSVIVTRLMKEVTKSKKLVRRSHPKRRTQQKGEDVTSLPMEGEDDTLEDGSS
jgi:hypothetical protein